MNRRALIAGALCVGGCAAVAAALPEFWRYDARTVTELPPLRVSTTPAPR